MPPELITGIFTSIGALVGAGGASVTSFVAARSQRRIGAEARREREVDMRRSTYTAFLSSAATYIHYAWGVATLLSSPSPSRPVDEVYAAHVEGWRDLMSATVAVEIAGPRAVGLMALALRQDVGAYADTLDVWYRVWQSDRSTPRPADLDEAYEKYRQSRDAFIATVQSTLGTV